MTTVRTAKSALALDRQITRWQLAISVRTRLAQAYGVLPTAGCDGNDCAPAPGSHIAAQAIGAGRANGRGASIPDIVAANSNDLAQESCRQMP